MNSSAHTPEAPGLALGRTRTWIVVAAAAAITALAELIATRLGSRPVDALRMTGLFAVLAGAAWLYGWYMRRIFGESAEQVKDYYVTNLARSKDTFIANVSHGLRTPLTGVVGFAHLLDASDLRGEEREAAQMIIAESAELSRMVDDLVTAAQLDSGGLTTDIQPVPMLAEVEKVLDFMDLIGAEIGLDLMDVDVLVDPAHFGQVLRNLVTNAHRHGKPTITVRGAVANGKYICHVVDQGPGVAPADQKRLFTRFSSSVFGSQFTGSVGLGLAVVAELTQRMGCEISYRRIRGETQFVLSIPLAPT
ncbi:MAG: HAMP domain-containing sensor histidine kinase, partial [Acidimicrobiia bacterium]|nr:HAMP domain-containing sensor histidine kinase [Acidimicrobiia bacterium]